MIETMKITIVDDCVVEANPKNEKKNNNRNYHHISKIIEKQNTLLI